MRHGKNLSVWMLLLPILLLSCVNLKQPSPKVNHYTLEYDSRRIGGLQPLSVVIRVEPFAAAPDYNSMAMVYRDEAFKRETYVYHKWRSSPGDLVSHFLVRDMRNAGVFQAVLFQESTTACTYGLEGAVDEFFEWNQNGDCQGVLAVSVTLLAENEPNITDRILFQRTYRTSTPCQQNNPASLAKALSLGLSDASEQIIKDIYACLSTPGQPCEQKDLWPIICTSPVLLKERVVLFLPTYSGDRSVPGEH